MDLTSVLPWLSAAISGNVPALAGLAVSKIGEVIGVDLTAATPTQVAQAVAQATPEQQQALTQAEQEFKLKMLEAGYKHEEELKRIELATIQTDTLREYQQGTLAVSNVVDARHTFGQNNSVFWLGVVILGVFALIMVITLLGSYALLAGWVTTTNPNLVAAVFGLVGTIIGYAAANAQQVVGYFYGSSAGSKEKSTALAQAVSKLGANV